MKVYKSRFLPKVEKAARKARSLKRGALYAHYIIGKGICTFIQGAYAVRGAVTTGSTDENEGSYLCEFDLEVNPHDHFFVDSKGNATQTLEGILITQEGAFKPLGNYNTLQYVNKIFDLKSVESLVTIDRKLLIELLEMMKDEHVTLSIVSDKSVAPKPFLKLDCENNNAFMLPILKRKEL